MIRFHFCRYIYWVLDRVFEQSMFERKKCKRMRCVFHKNSKKLTEEGR
ncbi:transposase [Alkalihalobacillus deserti]